MRERDYQKARQRDEEMPTDAAQSVALRKLLYHLADVDLEEGEDCGLIEAALRIADRIDHLEQDLADLRDEIETHGQVVDALGDITQSKTTKEQKVAAVVRYADQKRDADNDVMRVFPAEIKGLLDVSQRYAYQLVEDIADEYAWARERESRTKATAKDGGGRKRIKKALEIDFEGVHGEAIPLNEFNNDVALKEGSA